MPGLFGGNSESPDADTLSASTYRRSFHETSRPSESPPLGIVQHGDRDPKGYTVVDDDDVAGVVYGTISNRRGEVTADLVRETLSDPDSTLPTYDGPFALAFLDRAEGRFILATDKLATRSIYYTATGPFAFASEMQPVLTAVEDPTVDEQAVSDLLTMVHIWGNKTLVEEVNALRPASYVEYESGEWEERRYWTFSFGSRTDSRYVSDVASAYAESVANVTADIPKQTGVWLSGGLDSRILAAIMHNGRHPFEAFTYERPLENSFDPFRSSIDLAGDICETLGVEHHVVDMDVSDVRERIPELVEITGGQVGWNTLVNLSAVFDVDGNETPVMMEGSVPIVCGEHVWGSHLGGSDHPADVLYEIHARQSAKQVKDVLAADVEPKDTFIDEARATSQTGHDERILEATHQNYNCRKHFTNNKVARAHLGTREALAHGDLLDHVGDLPASYRPQMLPFTGGRIPHLPSKMKLMLMREVDGDLLDIPYEGTLLPPSYPHAIHAAGFVFKNAVKYGMSSSTIGNWYREDDDLRTFLDDLLAGAADRDLFDSGAVERVRKEHLAGKTDHISLIATITTVELFLRNVLNR
jgi:asparagine synthase (glutamine-hydrolysing)